MPTNAYLMDSAPISQFLESTYPDPAVPLTSELGREVEATARASGGRAFGASVMPREIRILSPRSQEYFRRTREATIGRRLEDLLAPGKEDETWDALADGMRATSDLIQTNKADGPFVLGARPTYTDFFVAGALQCMRTVDEGVFQRYANYPGQMGIYNACLPYMEKNN